MPNENEEEVKVEAEEVEEEAKAEPEAEAEAGSEEGKKEEKPSESPEDRATRLLRQTNQARKKLGLPPLGEAKPETKSSKKSDEFDYGVKAYLSAEHGIKGSEIDFVKNELKESGLKDLEALLGNPYFKSRLEEHRALNKTSEAIPKGQRSGGVPMDSVDYWLTKPIEDVPYEMRAKVVNARIKKEEGKGVFYNQK